MVSYSDLLLAMLLRRAMSTLSRDRVQRRVVDPKLKLSSLPEGFLNFSDIHLLPPRELAYTAHIAHKADLPNEQLWDDIRSAVVDSLGHLTPKQLTQCVLALAERSVLTTQDVTQISSWVGRRVEKFRLIDLIAILHAIAQTGSTIDAKHFKPIVTCISRLMNSGANHQLSLPAQVSLITAVGKLRIYNEGLFPKMVEILALSGPPMDQFQLSACVRSFGALASQVTPEHHQMISDTIADILTHHPALEWDTDPGCMNIILNGLVRIEKASNVTRLDEKLIDKLFLTLGRATVGTDLSLYPHLLLSGAQLARTEEAKQVCVRMASMCVRQYRNLKPVSLALVKEGLGVMRTKFPDDEDIVTIQGTVDAVAQSVIERFLLVQSEQELEELYRGKYCVYSEWLRGKVEEALNRGGEQRTGDQQDEPAPNTITSLLQELWMQTEPLSTSHIQQLESAWEDSHGQKSDLDFSLVARILLKEGFREDLRPMGLMVAEILRDLPPQTVSPRTYIRILQLIDKFGLKSVDPMHFVLKILIRMNDVQDKDLLPFLTLIRRLGFSFDTGDQITLLAPYQTDCERKIAISVDGIKSFSKRMHLINVAKSIGLNPEDPMAEYETALFSNKDS